MHITYCLAREDIILQIAFFQLNLKISLSGSKIDQSPASIVVFTINDEDLKLSGAF